MTGAAERAVDAANENHDELVASLFKIFCDSEKSGNVNREDVLPKVKKLIDAGVDVDCKWDGNHHEVGHCTIVLAAVSQHAQRVKNDHGGIRSDIIIVEALGLILPASKDPDKLVNALAFEDQPDSQFHGLTPVMWASMVASLPLVKFLVKNGADLEMEAPTLRINALKGAKMFGSEGNEKVVEYLESVLQSEARILVTVDDVCEWIRDIAPFFCSKEWIEAVVQRCVDQQIDAEKLFSLHSEQYTELVMSSDLLQYKMKDLDGEKEHWLHPLVYQRSNQRDNEQIPLYEKAAAAVASVHNKKEENYLVTLQHQIRDIISTGAIQRAEVGNIISKASEFWEKMKDASKREISRIERVSEACEDKYNILKERYDVFRNVKDNAKECGPENLIQPVRKVWSMAAEGPLLQSASTIEDAAQFHIIHAQNLHGYFSYLIAELESLINTAASPDEFELPKEEFPIPFLAESRFMVNGKTRCSSRVAPIKSATRAVLKAQTDYIPPERPDKIDGKPVSPVDYVLDWLRATFVAEDPYVLAACLALIRDGKFPYFELIRTKNNVTKKTHNVLTNVYMLYPKTEEDFKVCKLLGKFDPSLAGKRIANVEIQYMLFDFLQVKKVQHKHYEIARCGDGDRGYVPILKTPVFIKDETRVRYESKISSMAKEITELRERIAELEGNSGEA